MHHKPAIALDLAGIRGVVMDAVTVEGDCRVTEQHGGVCGDLPACRAGGGRVRRRCWRAARRRLAVDDVLAFTHRKRAAAGIFVDHRDKTERSAAALLDLHIVNPRCPRHHLVDH